MGILSNGRTFLVAFSYVRREDHESYAFFWESLKEHWPTQAAEPIIVISDQAPSILSSLEEQLPMAKHQIYEWHVVKAMLKRFRKSHTNTEISSGKDVDGTKIEGIKDFA